MEKVFDFIRSLKPSFYKDFGYPTIKVYSDYVEVYFDVHLVVRDFSFSDIECDDLRMFSGDDCITIVYTFYILPFEE